ncbi:MAG: EutN/CcmL family microcompartment protein [Oscillospiraceae bacterium]|nr:EutN/CcmL family microcompartment protein [Oscillospiraceae bacterium]
MKICEVIGHVWATKKEESLSGLKLMVVKQIDVRSDWESIPYVAADMVGAGIGERVLVVEGSTARHALSRDNLPVDSTIVGIIDSLDVKK